MEGFVFASAILSGYKMKLIFIPNYNGNTQKIQFIRSKLKTYRFHFN